MSLEDIGEGDGTLLCITNLTTCCRPPHTDEMGGIIGNWFFPNGTRVPNSGKNWDFHRTRGQMVIHMHRRRGGVDGIFRCVIPDAENITQSIYIGVYSASTGEWYIYTLQPVLCNDSLHRKSTSSLIIVVAICYNKHQGHTMHCC